MGVSLSGSQPLQSPPAVARRSAHEPVRASAPRSVPFPHCRQHSEGPAGQGRAQHGSRVLLARAPLLGPRPVRPCGIGYDLRERTGTR